MHFTKAELVRLSDGGALELGDTKCGKVARSYLDKHGV